ncbi:MAG TPA: cell division protein ZipA [Gammaproteobacteria bacterium]|nr:cell division protein ZipA [Gammaproteobacteria bacterium]
MNELRWILLLLGLVIIAGIYFWGTRASARRWSRRHRYSDDESLELSSMPRKADNDLLDYTETLIDQPWLEEDEDQAADVGGAQAERERAPYAYSSDGRIIVLYLIAPPDQPYSGNAIHNAAGSVGMRFGDMGVYHYFGVGAMRSPRSLFCLADMLEPGSFDLKEMENFETSGVVLFMQLPPPGFKRVAFDLMLNTAQRLLKRLHGELLDDYRKPLTAEGIERLRNQVANAVRV